MNLFLQAVAARWSIQVYILPYDLLNIDGIPDHLYPVL
jgi:hypothetical protein